MALSAKDIQVMVSRQTGIARKVYDVVPIEDSWTSKQVVQEMARLGSRPDVMVIEGCLNSLRQSGLIVEPTRGHFQRAKAREDRPHDPEPQKHIRVVTTPIRNEAPPVSSTKSQPKEPGQFEVLTAAAEKLRGMSKYLSEIANEIDSAALAMLQEASDSNQELAKLQQLKSLLKDLT